MTNQEEGHIKAIKCNCGAVFSYSINDSITAISRSETKFRSKHINCDNPIDKTRKMPQFQKEKQL